MSPLRTTTVPLAMTEPETVTIFALWMATAGWDWARAKAQHTNSAETRFFIMAIGLYGVYEATNGYTTGATHYRLHSTPYTGSCLPRHLFSPATRACISAIAT